MKIMLNPILHFTHRNTAAFLEKSHTRITFIKRFQDLNFLCKSQTSKFPVVRMTFLDVIIESCAHDFLSRRKQNTPLYLINTKTFKIEEVLTNETKKKYSRRVTFQRMDLNKTS